MWVVGVSLYFLSSLLDPMFWLFAAIAAFLASRSEFHWAVVASLAGALCLFAMRLSLWHAVAAWLLLIAVSAVSAAVTEYYAKPVMGSRSHSRKRRRRTSADDKA